jgi:hypothetical protein
MKIDHGGVFILSQATELTIANWMRLHEVHRIKDAKSMAGGFAPRRLD